ncbi:hypothetical protein F2Q68_00044023 [Brassica cretica]|uniref:Uncharacterized protein n=1 Tax=Brassica cretica TaxID=69181 RepID=A0A8S9LMH1_BRACR|nr:hypothetical protein F2Q68_00044023 [Brassica cretica]
MSVDDLNNQQTRYGDPVDGNVLDFRKEVKRMRQGHEFSRLTGRKPNGKNQGRLSGRDNPNQRKKTRFRDSSKLDNQQIETQPNNSIQLSTNRIQTVLSIANEGKSRSSSSKRIDL